jgi:hypothetical protein
MRRIHEDDHVLYEAALQRQKDSKGSAKPLNRREAFRAVWRDRWLGSDADAALAEKRFRKRLDDHRAGHCAPPAWLLPGSCLAAALGLYASEDAQCGRAVTVSGTASMKYPSD